MPLTQSMISLPMLKTSAEKAFVECQWLCIDYSFCLKYGCPTWSLLLARLLTIFQPLVQIALMLGSPLSPQIQLITCIFGSDTYGPCLNHTLKLFHYYFFVCPSP